MVALLNIATFFIYGYDKRCAVKDRRRIPERVLIILAVLGGGIGAALAMAGFRHKTKHAKFTIIVPLCMLAQMYVIYRYLL